MATLSDVGTTAKQINEDLKKLADLLDTYPSEVAKLFARRLERKDRGPGGSRA